MTTFSLSLLAAISYASDPGVTDVSITLGMSAPLTGLHGSYGIDMQRTIEAYFANINKNGGIHGRKLGLVALDDGYETDRTVANANTLIKEKKVFALLSFYGSSPTIEAMNKVVGPARVPLVGTISGAASLREPISTNPNLRYMFNVRSSYAEETALLVKHLTTLGTSRIAVFYQNDGFGKSGLEGVTAALNQHKLTPVAVGSVERNSLDVTKAVADIVKSNPQAIIMVTLSKPTSVFIKAVRQAQLSPNFLVLSPVGTQQLIQELGDTDARGIAVSQVVPHPWTASTPVVREYQKFCTSPCTYSYYGMEGFLMARTMVEGLSRMNSKDMTRERLVTALESLSEVDYGGFKIGYTPTSRRGSSFTELTVVGQGGKILK